MSRICTRANVQRAAAFLTLAAAFALLLATPLARAATDAEEAPSAAIDEVVGELVREALESNLELDVAGAEAAARLAALDQARARYLPVLDFNARYSAADGGRTIDFPVGDLLNPIYATLNQLTGQQSFPTVANQKIPFLLHREQDTRFSLTQPLYDARIPAARAASSAEYDASRATRAALAGRIDRDMRTAYYRWLEARARRGILDATLELARANRRVNDSLYANGKITRDLVYRAEADVLDVEQTRLAADRGVHLAQSYVNLIRNAPFDRPLPVAEVGDEDLERLRTALAHRLGVPELEPPALAGSAVDHRAELKALDAAVAAAAADEQIGRAHV